MYKPIKLQFIKGGFMEKPLNLNPSPKYTSHPQLSPELSFQIILHGFLLWTSVGFLMPVGILTIRMSNREQCGRRIKIMFFIHATLQIISIILVAIAAVVSIKNFENSFKNVHQRMGITLYGLVLIQAFLGFFRSPRGSRRRSVWFSIHWIIGTTVSLLGIINIYTGLQAYHKMTSKSIRLWTIFLTAEISCIAFFYLFQDKWDYIQQQGVVLGNESIRPTDQELSPRDKKDVSGESTY